MARIPHPRTPILDPNLPPPIQQIRQLHNRPIATRHIRPQRIRNRAADPPHEPIEIVHLPHHAVLVHDDLESHALARLVEALLRLLARREEGAEVRVVVGFAGEGEGAALGEVVFVAREDELRAGLADGLQGAVRVGGTADGAEGGEAGGEDGGGEVVVGKAGVVDVPVHVGEAG